MIWQKTLWRKQPFQDNYVPPTQFLSSLKRNANFRPYTYWPLVLHACGVVQHTSVTFIFIAVFVRLREQAMQPHTLVLASVGCFMVGYALWQFLNRTNSLNDHLKAFKSSILIFLSLMSLSPVLRTLTSATSSDSIWALSAFLLFLNGLLADYRPLKTDAALQERLTSVLSMNAAVSASVVLASRLTTEVAVFALILFSVQAFTLFPILRHCMQVRLAPRIVFLGTSRLSVKILQKASPPIIQVSLTIALSAFSVHLTAPISWTVGYIMAAAHLFVALIAPAILVWAQRFKNEIRGPWDVAVPRVR